MVKYAVHSENKEKVQIALILKNVKLSIIDMDYIVDSPEPIPEFAGMEYTPTGPRPNPDAKKGASTEDPLDEIIKDKPSGRGGYRRGSKK